MDDIKTIEVLNKLIQINNDRFEGYETAFKKWRSRTVTYCDNFK
jgi:hypothetical protein